MRGVKMKTLKVVMTFLMLSTLVLSITSCNESTSAPTNNKGSQSTDPITPQEEQPSLGPTGINDPITMDDVNMDGEVTYYDQPDPSDDPVLPGTPYNSCGVVYRQFNNPTLFFRNDSNQIFTLREFSYDSVVFLRNIRFGQDSYNVCLEGYRNNTDIHLNLITSQSTTAHPLKVHAGQYSYELCGQLAYITNFSGQTSLNLRIDQFDYLITTANDSVAIPNVVPNTTTVITSEDSIEACLYSNRASFKDYSVTFKPQFEIEALDLGALNP
jgi:hypothetical protein